MSGQKWREKKERERARETTAVSWPVLCLSMWLYGWQCLSASAWICTDSAFCLCNDSNRRGGWGGGIKDKRIFPMPCYLKTVYTYCSSFLSFLLFGGVARERGKIISVRFGEQMQWGELWGGAVLAVLAHVWSETYWAMIGQFQGPPGRLRPCRNSLWQNGTSFLEIRAFSTRQGRVPSKLTTQSFNT